MLPKPEVEQVGETWIRWMADQHGSNEGVWGLAVVANGPEEAARVASEPELVMRLMSVVEVKLRL
jgi:hypothetical protein